MYVRHNLHVPSTLIIFSHDSASLSLSLLIVYRLRRAQKRFFSPSPSLPHNTLACESLLYTPLYNNNSARRRAREFIAFIFNVDKIAFSLSLGDIQKAILRGLSSGKIVFLFRSRGRIFISLSLSSRSGERCLHNAAHN